jgi:hypothetical protein
MPYLFAIRILIGNLFDPVFRVFASAMLPYLNITTTGRAREKENPFLSTLDPSLSGVRAASLMTVDAIDNECFALVATIVFWTGVDCFLNGFDKLFRRLFPFHDCTSFSSGFADVLRM